jgi:hypothetical protein
MVMEYAQDGEFFDYVMDGKMYPVLNPAKISEKLIITLHKLSQASSISISWASHIETSNQRTCSLMFTNGSKSLTSDCPTCTNLKNNYLLLVDLRAMPLQK